MSQSPPTSKKTPQAGGARRGADGRVAAASQRAAESQTGEITAEEFNIPSAQEIPTTQQSQSADGASTSNLSTGDEDEIRVRSTMTEEEIRVRALQQEVYDSSQRVNRESQSSMRKNGTKKFESEREREIRISKKDREKERKEKEDDLQAKRIAIYKIERDRLDNDPSLASSQSITIPQGSTRSIEAQLIELYNKNEDEIKKVYERVFKEFEQQSGRTDVQKEALKSMLNRDAKDKLRGSTQKAFIFLEASLSETEKKTKIEKTLIDGLNIALANAVRRKEQAASGASSSSSSQPSRTAFREREKANKRGADVTYGDMITDLNNLERNVVRRREESGSDPRFRRTQREVVPENMDLTVIEDANVTFMLPSADSSARKKVDEAQKRKIVRQAKTSNSKSNNNDSIIPTAVARSGSVRVSPSKQSSSASFVGTADGSYLVPATKELNDLEKQLESMGISAFSGFYPAQKLADVKAQKVMQAKLLKNPNLIFSPEKRTAFDKVMLKYDEVIMVLIELDKIADENDGIQFVDKNDKTFPEGVVPKWIGLVEQYSKILAQVPPLQDKAKNTK